MGELLKNNPELLGPMIALVFYATKIAIKQLTHGIAGRRTNVWETMGWASIDLSFLTIAAVIAMHMPEKVFKITGPVAIFWYLGLGILTVLGLLFYVLLLKSLVAEVTESSYWRMTARRVATLTATSMASGAYLVVIAATLSQ